MGKIVSMGIEDLAKSLGAVADNTSGAAKAAVYAGAGVGADRVRSALDSQATEANRDHKTRALLPYEKDALQKGLTIEKIIADKARGITYTTVTFHGRSDHKTESYPNGIPTILIARAVNKGTSFRTANRWMPNAINRSRKQIENAMTDAAERVIKGYLK